MKNSLQKDHTLDPEKSRLKVFLFCVVLAFLLIFVKIKFGPVVHAEGGNTLIDKLKDGRIERTPIPDTPIQQMSGTIHATGGSVFFGELSGTTVRMLNMQPIDIYNQLQHGYIPSEEFGSNQPLAENTGKLLFEIREKGIKSLSITSCGSTEMFDYLNGCKEDLGFKTSPSRIVISDTLINALGVSK